MVLENYLLLVLGTLVGLVGYVYVRDSNKLQQEVTYMRTAISELSLLVTENHSDILSRRFVPDLHCKESVRVFDDRIYKLEARLSYLEAMLGCEHKEGENA